MIKNMIKKLFVLIVFLLGLIFVTCFFVSIVFFQHQLDWLVASSIPRYPGASSYKIEASSGFPDGIPGASIRFETKDSAEDVINFYETKLVKKGWNVESKRIDTKTWPWEKYHIIEFSRDVFGIRFRATFTKPEGIRDSFRELPAWTSIFVYHRR
ncbi:MAG: hypothetical protein ACOZBZ_03935 [Patescibacteria group bacterium]